MSCEYRTIVSCTDQLETAFRPPSRDLVHFLQCEGFISDEVHQAVLNPRLLNDHQKAGELVAGIRKEVKLNAQKYYKLINFLQNTEKHGKLYESIVAILDRKHWEEEKGNRRAYIWNIIYYFIICVLMALCTILLILLARPLLPKLTVWLYGGTGIYSTHLKAIYAKHKVLSGGKWPAIKAKAFINLAIVSYTPRDLNEIREHLLHGNIQEMLEGKESIELEDIFESKGNESVSLVLVEGAPGIGKSTLAWELCRRWWKGSSFMKRFSLVVLHRLRDEDTQQIHDIFGLFPGDDEALQQRVRDEVSTSAGKGILFILDGFDEFPHRTSRSNFLVKLMTKRVLPESTVLVTTRPAATATFLLHEPTVNRRIEILGFTQKQVKQFAVETFADSEPELLENFLKYSNASENPAINSLMYIPLNAAIIAEIYKNNYKSGFPIPKTLTQLYTELCLTMLRRHLTSHDPNQTYILYNIRDLSDYNDFYTHFQNLSQLAFEKFNDEKVIFYTLPKELIHFGLLDSVQALHGGAPASYNFLHLTIQEFLVAYHIYFHDAGKQQTFRENGSDERWNLVWRFVAGFSKFEFFTDSKHDKKFVQDKQDFIEVKLFFFLCLFEAEVNSDFDLAKFYESEKIFHFDRSRVRHIITPKIGTTEASLTPMDKYAVGYFLVNSAPVTWELKIRAQSLETFVWGLNSIKNYEKRIIHSLNLINTNETYLNDFPKEILHGITHLSFRDCDLSALDDVISNLINLNSLSIVQTASAPPEMIKNVDIDVEHTFQQLPNNTNLQSLTLSSVNSSFQCVSAHLNKLIDPRSGSLKHLEWTVDDCDLIFGPSSLAALSVSCVSKKTSFSLLKTNSNLQNLTIRVKGNSLPSPHSLKTALEHNSKLEYLKLVIHDQVAIEDCDNLILIAEAIKHGRLKELSFEIKSKEFYRDHERDFEDLNIDSRIITTSSVL